MTVTDIHEKSANVQTLIEDLSCTPEEKAELHHVIGEYGKMLERIWFLMIDLDNSIQKCQDQSFKKLLMHIRNEMATRMGEPNRYEKVPS